MRLCSGLVELGCLPVLLPNFVTLGKSSSLPEHPHCAQWSPIWAPAPQPCGFPAGEAQRKGWGAFTAQLWICRFFSPSWATRESPCCWVRVSKVRAVLSTACWVIVKYTSGVRQGLLCSWEISFWKKKMLESSVQTNSFYISLFIVAVGEGRLPFLN